MKRGANRILWMLCILLAACGPDPPADAEAGGGRPRYYGITEKGRSALSSEVARLSSYVATALAKNV